jgi:hypothetical protein
MVTSLIISQMHEFGKLQLNKNPENFHRDVEQVAFSPSTFMNGVLIQTRSGWDYVKRKKRDTVFARLGNAQSLTRDPRDQKGKRKRVADGLEPKDAPQFSTLSHPVAELEDIPIDPYLLDQGRNNDIYMANIWGHATRRSNLEATEGPFQLGRHAHFRLDEGKERVRYPKELGGRRMNDAAR